MGGSFVLLSQQEGWWESTGVRAGWDFIAVLWQRGVASSDPTDCWFNNGAAHRSRGVRIPFIEDNFNQPWLSCLCYCFKGVVSLFFFLDHVSFSFRRVGNAVGRKTFLSFASILWPPYAERRKTESSNLMKLVLIWRLNGKLPCSIWRMVIAKWGWIKNSSSTPL